jgi:hypothetical protein
MDTSILVAIITTSGSIIALSISYYMTKKMQNKSEWQHEKMNHYRELLSALSDLAVDGIDKKHASEKFSHAVNTICLVAPQYVVESIMEFHNEIKFTNKNKDIDKHDVLLTKLILAIRKDIGLSKNDNDRTFNFHLIGKAPK